MTTHKPFIVHNVVTGSGGSGGTLSHTNTTLTNVNNGTITANTALLAVTSSAGEAVLKVNSNGTLEHQGQIIKIDDLFRVVKIMKIMAINIANDKELSKKMPDVTEFAHSWLMDSLKNE
jgi:hypothetical protein